MSTKDSKKWVNLSAAYLALVGGFVAYTGWTPSLARITEDLQLGYAEAGSLSSVTAIVAGAMTLIGGFAATRWSAKSVVLWGLAAGVVDLHHAGRCGCDAQRHAIEVEQVGTEQAAASVDRAGREVIDGDLRRAGVAHRHASAEH